MKLAISLLCVFLATSIYATSLHLGDFFELDRTNQLGDRSDSPSIRCSRYEKSDPIVLAVFFVCLYQPINCKYWQIDYPT